MARPKLGVLTCLWQRHELTDVVLGWYGRLKGDLAPHLDLELLAVGSERETSRSLAERNGFAYIERPNSPLGAKWNAGLGAMEGLRLDAVVIVGSDDVVSGSLFRLYADAISQGIKYMGLADMYFLELASRTLCFWPGYPPGIRHRETLGLGRCLHVDLIQANQWQLWDNWLERGLDGSMTRRLAPMLTLDADRWRSKTFHCREERIAAIGLKSDVNLWSFPTVVGVCDVEYLDCEATLRELLPQGFVEDLTHLAGSM